MTQYSAMAADATRLLPDDRKSHDTLIAQPIDFPGFGPLTPIDTDFGPVPAQTLRVRDRVRLRCGRFCPIARIDKVLLDEAFIERNHHVQPVLIEPGRLGHGLPAKPVLLAPGQKLSDRQGLPGSSCTARDVLRAGKAHLRPERFLTYIVFSFPEPQDVCSNGLWLRVEPLAMQHEESGDQAGEA